MLHTYLYIKTSSCCLDKIKMPSFSIALSTFISGWRLENCVVYFLEGILQFSSSLKNSFNGIMTSSLLFISLPLLSFQKIVENPFSFDLIISLNKCQHFKLGFLELAFCQPILTLLYSSALSYSSPLQCKHL